MKLLFYHLLLLGAVAAAANASLAGLALSVAFIPLVQTLPSPYIFLISPPNLVIVAVAGYAMKAREKNEAAEPLRRYILLWLAVLAIGLAIAIVRFPSTWLETALEAWYWATPFVIFLILVKQAFTRAKAQVLIWAALISIFGECFVAIYERAQGVGRATAHLDEPNRAGAYFAGALVLSLAWTLRTRGKQQILFACALLVAAGAVFATLSRGAMLSSTVGGTVIFASFLLRPSQHSGVRKLLYVVILVMVIANIALVLPERVRERLLFTFQQHPDEQTELEVEDVNLENLDGSAANRVQLWTWAMQLAKESPFGHGAFRARDEIARFYGMPKAVHNIYLQVLVEFGVQGLLVLLLLVFGVLKRLYSLFSSGETDGIRTMALGLAGFWIAFCVAHIFVNPFFMMQVNGQFWILLAVLCAANARLKAHPEERGMEGDDEPELRRVSQLL